MITASQQEIILTKLSPFGPEKIAVFGSFARGENTTGSDLDILVHLHYPNRISLLDLAGIEEDLSDALGIKVDLVTEKFLSPHIRPYVEKDLRYILE